MSDKQLTEERSFEFNLTPAELEKRSKRLATATDEMREQEQAKKDSAAEFKSRIEGLDKEITVLARAVRTETEERPVVCVWKPCPATYEMELRRSDNHELVCRRPMTDYEQRKIQEPSLLGDDAPDHTQH